MTYGPITETSKAINLLLGDETDRSICRRTAHGFLEFTKWNLDEEVAEHLVHTAIVTSWALLTSKKDGLKVGGGLIAAGLFLCYLNGRR